MQSIIGHLGKKYSFQTVFTVANRTKGNLHELVPGYYEALQNLQSAQADDLKKPDGWWWNLFFLAGGVSKFVLKRRKCPKGMMT
jgi:hypothetical protein